MELRLPWNFPGCFLMCLEGKKKIQVYFPSLYGIYAWVILNRYANLLHRFLMLVCCFIFSGVWLLVWEWVHALCLYPLSLWKCWTLWEQLSWAFCGWRTGSNSWMVGFLPFSCLFYDTCQVLIYMNPWFHGSWCFWLPCLDWICYICLTLLSTVEHQTYLIKSLI